MVCARSDGIISANEKIEKSVSVLKVNNELLFCIRSFFGFAINCYC